MAVSITKYIRQLIYSEGMTPLPYTTVFVLVSVVFVNGMVTTMCMSYLPKMVKSFGVSEVQTGRYVGLIVSCIFVGMLTCSFLWGHFADTKGRKLALLLALAGMTLTTLLFAFSTSVTWTLLSRLAQGLFTGALTVAKSILAHALDETNTALGFSIFFTCWTIAFIVGPTLAGFLVFPVEQYPDVFTKDSFFAKFGIMLPNLLIVMCNVILIILIITFLPNDRKKHEKRSEETICLIQGPNNSIYSEESIGQQNDYCDDANWANSNIKASNTTQVNANINKKEKEPGLSAKLLNCFPPGVLKALTLFKSKDFVICLITYALHGFCMVGLDDMFPVFAASSTEYNGLGLSPSQIGIIFLASACMLLVLQLTVTSKVCKQFGPRKTLIGSTLLLGFTIPLVPTISAVSRGTEMFIFAVFILLTNQVGINASIVCINVLLNNCVTADSNGLANGIGLTANALGRMCAPAIYGSLYSWSLTNVKNVRGNEEALGYPFNQFFVFLLISLSFLLTSFLTTFLSVKLDTPMVEVGNCDEGKKRRIGDI